MVELLSSLVLLGLGIFLVWLAYTHNRLWGFFGGVLFLVFGVSLLGSGFQYETGSSVFVSYEHENHTQYELHYTCATNYVLDLTTFNCTKTTPPAATISPDIEFVWIQTPLIMNETTTNTTTRYSDTGTLNQGVSVFFIFLGLLIMFLAGIDLTRPKSFVSKGVDSELEREVE